MEEAEVIIIMGATLIVLIVFVIMKTELRSKATSRQTKNDSQDLVPSTVSPSIISIDGVGYCDYEVRVWFEKLSATDYSNTPLFCVLGYDNLYGRKAIRLINDEGMFVGFAQDGATDYICELINQDKIYVQFLISSIKNKDTILVSIFKYEYDSEDEKQDEIKRIKQLEANHKQQTATIKEQNELRLKRAQQAYLLEAGGDIDGAIAILTELIENKYSNADAFNRLCIMLRKKKLYDEELIIAEMWLQSYERHIEYYGKSIEKYVEIKMFEIARRINRIKLLIEKSNSKYVGKTESVLITPEITHANAQQMQNISELDAATDETTREKADISAIVAQSKFVAIDFETANDEISSACSLGLAFSDGNKVIATRHYYIKPTPNHFEPGNTAIHGIKPADIQDAPTFYELWNQIDDIVLLDFVAHNAEFDANVLRQAFAAGAPDHRCVMQVNDILFYCTRDLSRIVYPYLNSYKLDDVCRAAGVTLNNHHEATSDAVAAADIIHSIMKHDNMIFSHPLSPLTDVAERYQYSPKHVDEIKHMKPWGRAKRMQDVIHNHIKVSSKTLEAPNLDLVENKDTPFFGKKILITGVLENFEREQLSVQLKTLGATIQCSVSKRLDYIVVGEGAGWAKMQKVEECNATGANIVILNEAELSAMLPN